MNITLICQLEPCTYRDGDIIHCGDFAVHYPDTTEEAASIICGLRRWRYSSDHRCDGWDITLLLDGREPEDLDETAIEFRRQIQARAGVLIGEAEEQEREELLRRQEAKARQDEALARLAAQKRVEADRAKYDELKSKYGW